MSAPNFALKNASRFFVVGMPVYYTQEDIDANELDQDQLGEYDADGTDFFFQVAKDNVANELKAKGWDDIDEYDGDRSYPTFLFVKKQKTVWIGNNISVDIIVQSGYTSGYYQAANFDWIAKVRVQGLIDGWYEDFEHEADELEADDVISENWYGNKGLSKLHAEHIIKKIAAIIDSLKNEAEIAFSMYCDEEMYCTYQCFNGEAGYSATGKRLWQEVEEKKKKTA